jgi:Ca2+-binding EF-hand superfamily protein
MLNPTMLALTAGAAGIAFSSPAAAAQASTAPAATTPPKMLTRVQVNQKIGAEFKGLDTNHDGSLSKPEIEAAVSERVTEAGQLLHKRREEEFKKLDTNHDGQLTLAEYQAGITVTPRPGVADARLKELDANKDGKVTEAEFGAQTLAQFDRVDTNRDGTISQQEMAAAMKRAPKPAGTAQR